MILLWPAIVGTPSAPPLAPPLTPPPFDVCNQEGDEGNMVWLGIFLGLSASIGINLGQNMVSMGNDIQQAQKLEKKPKAFWVGTYMFAGASAVNFGAFAFAPAAMLAPLESVQFVTNLLFAKVAHRELPPLTPARANHARLLRLQSLPFVCSFPCSSPIPLCPYIPPPKHAHTHSSATAHTHTHAHVVLRGSHLNPLQLLP